MSLFTSSHFASATASGTDWRDTSKNVLEKLDGVRTDGANFNFGFLYISDRLADDAVSILNLFKSVMKIDNWIGSIGIGVIGCGESHLDKPAISAMVCNLPKDSFCIFPSMKVDETGAQDVSQDDVSTWLVEKLPVLGIVHGDPAAEKDPRQTLAELEKTTSAFYLGGLTSSRTNHFQIANGIFENAVSGAFFSDDVQVATTLSQGCRKIGAFHTITKADENAILTLDDKRAIDVLQDDLKELARSLNHDSEEIHFTSSLKFIDSSAHIPEEFKTLFRGQIHVAQPIALSDRNDYQVRNISGIDVDEGSITISEEVATGETVFFVQRDENSISCELTQSLVALRKRVTAERGCFEPKGALYVSCVARGFNMPKKKEDSELSLIRNIIGDVPMTGFYAGGEISNARIYGYTGILTLFF